MKATIAALLLTLQCMALALPPEQPGVPQVLELGDLNGPFGVDFDASGNMVIVELPGGRILKWTPDGELQHIGGSGEQGYSGDGGPVIEASFDAMHNVAIGPDGSLYISDHRNHAIRRVDRDGIVTTWAGGEAGFAGDGKTVGEARFNMVMSVSIDPAQKHLAIDPAGVVYIADDRNHLVRRFDPGTGEVTTVLGHGEIKLERPHGVHVHEGWLYVADSKNDRIIRVQLNDGEH